MLDCTMSRSVWALSNADLVEHMCMNTDDSAKGWLFAMSDSLPQEEFTKLVVTLWAIWHARRKLIHEGIFQSPQATHMFVQRFIDELGVLSNKQQRPRIATGTPAVQ